MAIADKRLTQRKELKFTKRDLKDIGSAASISGANDSAFIRTAAIEKAHKILESEKMSVLNNDDWNNFTSTVTTYTMPPKELKQNMSTFLKNYTGDK